MSIELILYDDHKIYSLQYIPAHATISCLRNEKQSVDEVIN